MLEKLYEMLMNENEITWQSIIYELVKTEQLDPWDINISLLAEKYILKIKELQEVNFFISGRVVLAASILLKIKSIKIVDENLAEFDDLLFRSDEDLLSEDPEENTQYSQESAPPLLIKTPQARKRKININDLIEALQKAFEVEHKRELRKRDERILREIELPKKKVDISAMIKSLYEKILSFFQKDSTVTFTQLLPSTEKIDKVYTFIPLLHLENQGKINLVQERQFGEIKITEYKEE